MDIIKKVLVAAAMLLCSSGAFALELGKQADGSVVVRLPPELIKACDANGGCAIVNQAEFVEAVNAVIQANKKEICDYKEAAK